jgi:hypothetical protein
MTIGIIIFLLCDLKEWGYYNRIGPKRLLFKCEQGVEKVIACHPKLGSGSANNLILLDAKTSPTWDSV